AATSTLATTHFVTAAGNRQLIEEDGGTLATLDWTDDAGEPLRVLERFTLMSAQRASAFYKRCPQPLSSCVPEQEQLWARTVSTATGETLEEVLLAPAGRDSTIVEAAMLDIPSYPPGVLTLVQQHSDAGANAYLRLALA